MIYNIARLGDTHYRYWTIHESFNRLKVCLQNDVNNGFNLSFDEDIGEFEVLHGRFNAVEVVDLIGSERFKQLLERYMSSNVIVNRNANHSKPPSNFVVSLDTDNSADDLMWYDIKQSLIGQNL